MLLAILAWVLKLLPLWRPLQPLHQVWGCAHTKATAPAPALSQYIRISICRELRLDLRCLRTDATVQRTEHRSGANGVCFGALQCAPDAHRIDSHTCLPACILATRTSMSSRAVYFAACLAAPFEGEATDTINCFAQPPPASGSYPHGVVCQANCAGAAAAARKVTATCDDGSWVMLDGPCSTPRSGEQHPHITQP